MKKLLCVLFGLAVLGMTSVFSAEGKKIEDLKTLFPDSSVSYIFNMNNKSANDVSIFLIKFVGNTKTEVYEYVIPAKTKDVIEFSAQIDNLAGEWWGFGWLDENNLVGNGSADCWSRQAEIVIDKDSWLNFKENGSTKKMAKIKKL